MAEIYEGRCEHCKQPFQSSRPHTKFCPGKSCRADAWHAKHPDRDTRTRGKGKALRSVARRGRRRHGKRADTEYMVLRLIRGKYVPVGVAKAHDRESAIRKVADGQKGAYIAVPARNMALLDQEGHPSG